MRLNRELVTSLPKIELHIHLDCSLSRAVVNKLRPQITESTYQKRFIAPEKCIDLSDFLACTSSGINLMQTEEELREVVKDLFVQFRQEHVIYAEIRFAPLLHLTKGLTSVEVLECVVESVNEHMKLTGIKAGLILCTLRHFNEDQSLHTIQLVEQFIKYTPVVGFDIASDEAGHPLDAHKKAFEYAIKKDIARTAHAGEAKGAESVWETLKYLRPQRIGHGVRCIEDEKLIAYLVKNDIHLEICPSSNIQTNIFNEYADHPIDFLFNAGVSIGVNTDARSLTNVSLTDEYMKLIHIFDWDKGHLYKCNMNALSHAFLSENEKEKLGRVLADGYI